jgi:hypothetical protein
MITRCHLPSDKGYRHYGGRGITVCERWQIFDNFAEDMGPRPKGMSLERKDVNGPYSPENCCWADEKTQANNRRSNVPITIDDVTKNLVAWSEESGVGPDQIQYRLKMGWDVHNAVFAKPYAQRNNNVFIEHGGKRGTAKEWEEWTGIPASVLYQRMKHGWAPERIVTEPVGTPLGGLAGKGNVSGKRHDNVMLTIDGETKTLAEWSQTSGTPQSTIRHRLERGWTHREAVYGLSESESQRRTVIRLTIDDVTHAIAEWSRISGTKITTIYHRLDEGWSHKEAVYGRNYRKPRKCKTLITFDGESRSAPAWEKISGTPAGTIYNRIKMGWTHREAVHGKGK